MCPSLIEVGSKTAEKISAQTNRQTDRHYENNGHLAVNQKCTFRLRCASSNTADKLNCFGERVLSVDDPGFQQDSTDGRVSSDAGSRCSVNCSNSGSCLGSICICRPGFHGRRCEHRTSKYNSSKSVVVIAAAPSPVTTSYDY